MVTIILCLEFFQVILWFEKNLLSFFSFLKTVWPSTYFKHFRNLVEMLRLNTERKCVCKASFSYFVAFFLHLIL